MPTARAKSLESRISSCLRKTPAQAKTQGISKFDRQIAQVVHLSQNWSTSIADVTRAYFAIRDWAVAKARIFTDEEQRSAAI